NEDYREADYFFSQIAEKHRNSELASQALELAIICKHMSTGGADYDGRKVAEARKLVQVAFEAYPKLAQDEEKRAFLMKQLDNITAQQAEQDFKKGEFYLRTSHPGSAYFYYELVRKRYPHTKYAQLAYERLEELRSVMEKEQGAAQAAPPQ